MYTQLRVLLKCRFCTRRGQRPSFAALPVGEGYAALPLERRPYAHTLSKDFSVPNHGWGIFKSWWQALAVGRRSLSTGGGWAVWVAAAVVRQRTRQRRAVHALAVWAGWLSTARAGYRARFFLKRVCVSSNLCYDVISNGENAMTDEALNALFGKADYSHIARDATVTVSITAAEMAALLGAYDRGLDALDQDERDGLNAVIGKLKDELWP